MIINTKEIADEQQAADITEKINNIAVHANIKQNKDNTPKILNGIFDEDTMLKIYNTIHCFIDCSRTFDYNHNLLIASAFQKDIVCNAKLSASDLFPEIHAVEAHPCNISYKFNNDLLSSSMYNLNYTMDCNHLQHTMETIYNNRYNGKTSTTEQLKPYDISNINNLLC